jgi:hypothetical protein
VELPFGMSVEETAEVLHVSEHRDSRLETGKVWLKRELIQADKNAG